MRSAIEKDTLMYRVLEVMIRNFENKAWVSMKQIAELMPENTTDQIHSSLYRLKVMGYLRKKDLVFSVTEKATQAIKIDNSDIAVAQPRRGIPFVPWTGKYSFARKDCREEKSYYTSGTAPTPGFTKR